ncbi:hypothetical protein O3M35_000100 [Rhynocoris fuscipes]|uniref:Uncharacterized protein n=1 Tax=Rhynocoris fuscipes TaxID=488301 RepID=A0AAW1DK73_9HEMI
MMTYVDFTLEEEETVVHVLCQCEGLARLGIMGEPYPSPCIMEEPLSRLKTFINESGA